MCWEEGRRSLGLNFYLYTYSLVPYKSIVENLNIYWLLGNSTVIKLLWLKLQSLVKVQTDMTNEKATALIDENEALKRELRFEKEDKESLMKKYVRLLELQAGVN